MANPNRVFLYITAGPSLAKAVRVLLTEDRGAIFAALSAVGGRMHATAAVDPAAAAREQRAIDRPRKGGK